MKRSEFRQRMLLIIARAGDEWEGNDLINAEQAAEAAGVEWEPEDPPLPADCVGDDEAVDDRERRRLILAILDGTGEERSEL
jgi:hypothetical protein